MALSCWFPRASAVLLWLSIPVTLTVYTVGLLPIVGVVVCTVVTATTAVTFLCVNAGVMLVAVIAIAFRWPTIPEALFWAGIVLLAVSIALGLVIRAVLRGSAERQHQEETIRQVREQAERARREERLRLAHEMHDYVAHELTVSVAALAATQFDITAVERRSDADREILEAVERSNRRALEELRHALRVLDTEDDTAADELPVPSSPFPPGPTNTASLPDLIEGAARDLRVVGDRVTLSVNGGAGLALGTADLEMARRFLTEGVTNAVKHGGLGAAVLIRADSVDKAVTIAIANTIGASVPPAESTGLGLRGLREEAERHGCELASGRSSDDAGYDWTIELRIPTGRGNSVA